MLFSHHKNLALYLLALALGLGLPLSISFADEQETKEKQLKQLKAEIGKLEKRLAEQTGQRSEALTDLRNTEIKIGKLSWNIEQLVQQIKTQDTNLAKLTTRSSILEKKLKVHRQSLIRQIRTAHRLGHRETLQLVLNQEDPALLGRAMTYANYLNKARVAAINDALLIARELNAVRAEQVATREQASQSRDNLLAEQANLSSHRDKRKKLVASLDNAIKVGGEKLAGLQADRKRLEELLKSLSNLLADIPAAPLERHPFKTLRGKLPWPAKGQIANRYNSAKGVGELKWRGILIAAPQGNNVRAIHYGQIVFADWLQGFGLITIIDHGGGYMSLYGHNQSLLKETGDWVVPGEVIATVGDSGGQSRNGLYFEVRDNGKPVNPQAWIAKKYHMVQAPG